MIFCLKLLLILNFDGGHKVVKDSLLNQLTQSNYKVAPGQKLCRECRKHTAATEDFCFVDEEGFANAGDGGFVNTETCHLPDDIEAWTKKQILKFWSSCLN